MGWEYKSVKLETSGFFGGKMDVETLNGHMNAMGSNGWELVTAFDTSMWEGQTRDVILLFKRPLG